MNEEGPTNLELAQEHAPLLTQLIHVLKGIDLVLFLASLKRNKLSQYFIYFWVLQEAVESFLPDKISLDKAV